MTAPSDSAALSLDSVALSLLPLSRWRRIAEQLRSGASATNILEALCREGGQAGTAPPDWADLRRTRERAREAERRGAAAGLKAIVWSNIDYPVLLREIVDPPPVLWVSGQAAALGTPAVAIVGSRAGTPYSLQIAERLGADLAAQGLTIVSGLARGVDSAAHAGALSVDGVTLAVLGSGADCVYPREHANLSQAVTRRGALVSELAPGTGPRAAFFPRRNRIISGLVRAVVVVEAGEKSGSLITARCALEQGRDVLAVPGNVLTGRNRGGHALIRDGARLVESAADVMDELGLWSGQTNPGCHPAQPADPVLAAMDPGEPVDLEQISAKSGLPPSQLLPRLMELELAAEIRREPGGRFVRFDRTC